VKKAVLTLSLLMMSSVSFAVDFAAALHERCSLKEVREITGSTGSCRTVVTPRPIAKSGLCKGTIFGSISCEVRYATSTDQSGVINLRCKTGSNVSIDESVPAEASGYSSAMLIRAADGQDLVYNNPEEISVISNPSITLLLFEMIEDGRKTTTADITLKLESRNYSLSDVVCQ